jgi:DNA-binding NarL/FixJ family response regulator
MRNLEDPVASGSAAVPPPPARVLIADDHDVICLGLERILGGQPEFEVCAIANSGSEALTKAIETRPDIAILDMKMDGLNGLECARLLRRELPDCEVLLFTGIETDELVRDAFISGAKSFILKSDVRAHLLDALRSLAQHKPYFTSKVSEIVFARLLRRRRGQQAEDGSGYGRLNAHDLEIVKSLAMGDSNRELAQRMGVNLRTAEGQRATVMRKMNFNSLADLVRYAVRNGIVEV